MIKLSPSTLNFFLDCPLCFWLSFNKGIKHPETIFPSLPSGMDRVMKEHFDSYRPELPPELDKLKGVKLFDDMQLLNVWRNNFKGISYEDKKIHAILRGAVDEILVKGGKLVVMDFKTRGFPLKEDTHKYYQEQMDIYVYLLEKNGFDVEHYAYLLFLHPVKMSAKGSVDFESDLVKIDTDPENAETLFHSAVKLLQSDKPPKEAEDCDHCRYALERR